MGVITFRAYPNNYVRPCRPDRAVRFVRPDVYVGTLNSGLCVDVQPVGLNHSVIPGIPAGRIRLNVCVTVDNTG